MRNIPGVLLILLAGCAAEPAAEAEPAPPPESATEAPPAPPAESTPKVEPAPPPAAGVERACDAAKAQSLLGRAQSAAAEAEAKRLSGAGMVRWIPEGGMVTMDYREDRLNLHLDSRDRIARIECG